VRVVVDTNVIVSSLINSHGAPGRIVQLFKEGQCDLLVSDEILAEYFRSLNYEKVARFHGLSPASVSKFLSEMKSFSLFTQVSVHIRAVAADLDDNKFIEAAVAGGAEFIVSGDKHLLELREYDGIHIVTLATFVAYLEASAST
jgi:putative PIN family toxin of toxin-antitoxin system